MPSQHREEAGRVPSYPDHGGLSSGEGATVRERRQRPHLRSNDRAEMTTSKRGSRRSFGEGVVRVFAVVSARELAEANSGNGGAAVCLAQRAVEEKKGELERVSVSAGAGWLQDAAATPECARRVASVVSRPSTRDVHAATEF